MAQYIFVGQINYVGSSSRNPLVAFIIFFLFKYIEFFTFLLSCYGQNLELFS